MTYFLILLFYLFSLLFLTDSCIGVYSYQSSEPGDLTFNVGEIIIVTKKDGDWWTGSIGDRSGIFPANYVKPHEVQVCIDSYLNNLYLI